MLRTFHHDTLEPASTPTFYFVGVTTGRSSIRTVFPNGRGTSASMTRNSSGSTCRRTRQPSNIARLSNSLRMTSSASADS